MLALNDLCQKAQNDIQEAIATESVIHSHLAAKQKHHSKEHSPNGRPNSWMEENFAVNIFFNFCLWGASVCDICLATLAVVWSYIV